MIERTQTGFWIAPFGIDGNLEGLGFWEFAKLSSKWVGFANELITRNPSNFDRVLGDKLSHIRVKFTSIPGAALLTISDSEKVASSAILLGGLAAEKEMHLAGMYIESLKKIDRVKVSIGPNDKPFQELLGLTNRPLVAVVPWPDELVDHDLVRELGIHLAGAFFLKK